jgi:hypothetical protein
MPMSIQLPRARTLAGRGRVTAFARPDFNRSALREGNMNLRRKRAGILASLGRMAWVKDADAADKYAWRST